MPFLVANGNLCPKVRTLDPGPASAGLAPSGDFGSKSIKGNRPWPFFDPFWTKLAAERSGDFIGIDATYMRLGRLDAYGGRRGNSNRLGHDVFSLSSLRIKPPDTVKKVIELESNLALVCFPSRRVPNDVGFQFPRPLYPCWRCK
jgi:hypothetical protein